MGLSSKSTQEAFARTPWLRVASLAGVSLLLIASLFGVWKAFSLPAKTEQPVAVAKYEHRGEFDYSVYLKPNTLYGSTQPKAEETKQKTSVVFFREIIDQTWLAFSYKFDSSEPIASITNDVLVTIIAENPGKWQKQVSVLEETHKGREFRVDFPLRLKSLDKVVEDIEEDIGVTGFSREFIIKAVVHTTAETATGKNIEDDFSHAITASLQAKTLELKGALRRSDSGAKEGVTYKEEGRFDYEVYLKPNKLYGPIVLRSEPLPMAEPPPGPPVSPQALGPGLVYFLKIVDNIKGTFSYRFECDRPVRNLVEEVEVMALVEYPGMWTKSFTLVPKTRKSGPFVVDFPVDISEFKRMTDTLRGELGLGAATYDLTIEAVVHTMADTDSGHIDGVFTHSLGGKLGMTTLTWTGDLGKKQPGTIEGSTTVPVPSAARFRVLSLAGLALVAFGFLFVVKNSRQARALAISRMEQEALRAKRKHKNVIVDVGELPPTGAGEVVIPIESVDEVVRTADALLKPVLHQVEADKHTYCVIDGTVRYQYISQSQNNQSPDGASS